MPEITIDEPDSFITEAAKPLFTVIRQLGEAGCKVGGEDLVLENIVTRLEKAFADRR